jgi:outer membrane immunogenic protein
MKTKKLIIITALASALIAPSAFAQSVFQGFYGQIGIGYESSAPSFSGGGVTGTPYSYSVSSSNLNYFTGTVAAGYYFPITNAFLLGIGAEYSPIESPSTNYTVTVPSAKYTEQQGVKKQNSYNIFISPAWAIDKEKLAYAKIGYAGAQYKAEQTDNFTGYSLGLGYRQIITGNWYGFGEANYTSYGNQNLASNATGTVSIKAMNALVGVGYKF